MSPTSVFSFSVFLRYTETIVTRFAAKANVRSSWRLLLALLCISLVLACGTIQAVHVHPEGDISHTDCPLCTTAHLTVQVVQQPITLFVAPVLSVVEAFNPLTTTRSLCTFALFTRPPPADLLPA